MDGGKSMFFQGLMMKGLLLITVMLLLEIHCFKAHKSNTNTATTSLSVAKVSEISGTKANGTQMENLPKTLLWRTRRSSAEIDQLSKSPVSTTTRATPGTTRRKSSRSRSSTTKIPGTDWFHHDDPSGKEDGFWFKFEDDGETIRMMPGDSNTATASFGEAEFSEDVGTKSNRLQAEVFLKMRLRRNRRSHTELEQLPKPLAVRYRSTVTEAPRTTRSTAAPDAQPDTDFDYLPVELDEDMEEDKIKALKACEAAEAAGEIPGPCGYFQDKNGDLIFIDIDWYKSKGKGRDNSKDKERNKSEKTTVKPFDQFNVLSEEEYSERTKTIGKIVGGAFGVFLLIGLIACGRMMHKDGACKS